MPKTCWRWENASLKCVWTYGLNLPWPIDGKRDFGRLPKTQRKETPQDSIVQAWAEALSHEPDPYLRLMWLLVAEHGWRSSHVGHLKWRNVRFDESGRPVAIIADGSVEDFKTPAPIAARLCPDVADGLLSWKKIAAAPFPERPILPWRWGNGKVDPARGQSRWSLHEHWIRLESKWNLPHLRIRDLRHWVATKSRQAGLSKQAIAYLMGHDATQGGAMRDWYDNPGLEDIFAEQAECLPDGALGILKPVDFEIELSGGLPSGALELLKEYFAGKVNIMALMNEMESMRLKLAEQTPSLEK